MHQLQQKCMHCGRVDGMAYVTVYGDMHYQHGDPMISGSHFGSVKLHGGYNGYETAGLPHGCSVCGRNPHDYVKGVGWVTEDYRKNNR